MQSDPMAEETPYESGAMRRFAGVEAYDDRTPDETTIHNRPEQGTHVM